MAQRFSGFPAEGIGFLAELKQNNDREWFQARKETYETQVKQPTAALVAALNEELDRFAPGHVRDPAKAMFRIYRDTRFSADKTPYKTHTAAHFPLRAPKGVVTAGFYFEISPGEVGIGGGLYMPPARELLAVRTWLADHHEEFRKLLSAKPVRKLLGDLYGDQLTRAPKGFPKDHPADDLLRRKSFFVWAELPAEAATTPKIVKEIASRFEAAAPIVEALNRALGR